MAEIPSALHHLLGTDLASITPDALERLIGAEEGQSLEFKTIVEDTKAGKEEFADDVTALANGGGGLLIIGIPEDRDTGRALSIAGIERSGDEALRLEQILASRVQPPLPVDIVRVGLPDGHDVIVVAVEGGPYRPHAVLSSGSKLSYPIRVGRQKQHLSEAQVADSYARRFTSATDRQGRLIELHVEHGAELPLNYFGWLIVTALPSSLGPLPLTETTIRAIDSTIKTFDLTHQSQRFWQTRTGYQGLIAASPRLAVDMSASAFLQVDGSGSIAFGYRITGRSHDGQYTREHQQPGATKEIILPNAVAFAMVADQLRLLAVHARKSGASGPTNVAVQFISDVGRCYAIPPGQRIESFNVETAACVSKLGRPSYRTVDLPRLVDDPAAVLDAARLLSVDVLSEFGELWTGVHDESGRLDPLRFEINAPDLHAWAVREGAVRPRPPGQMPV